MSRRIRKKPTLFITNDRIMIKCYGGTIAKKVFDFLYKHNYNWSSTPPNKQEADHILKWALDAYGSIYIEVVKDGYLFYQGTAYNDDLAPTVMSGTKFLKMMQEDTL